MTVVAQLSDVHIRPRGMLYQNLVDSNAMLVSAIEAINRLRPAPDAVLVLSGFLDIIISWETVSKVLLQSHERQTIQDEGSDALFQVAL